MSLLEHVEMTVKACGAVTHFQGTAGSNPLLIKSKVNGPLGLLNGIRGAAYCGNRHVVV